MIDKSNAIGRGNAFPLRALCALDNTNHDPCTTKTFCLGKRPERKPRQVTLLNLFATTSQAQSLLSKTAHPDTNSQYQRQWELFASSCLPTTRCRLSSVCSRSHQSRSLHDHKSSGEDTLAGQTPGEDTLAGQTPQLFLAVFSSACSRSHQSDFCMTKIACHWERPERSPDR